MENKILVHIRPIESKLDYKNAVNKIEALMELSKRSKKEDAELDILATLVERYEEIHFSIDKPDPIEAIKFRMEQMNLTQKNLGEIVGSKQRASEYLGRKIPLSIGAIRKINSAMNISGDILLQEYELVK
jgi:HTH-type transcriptional regulator / antitoxin HigA